MIGETQEDTGSGYGKGFSLRKEGKNFVRGITANPLILVDEQSWFSSLVGICLVLAFIEGCKMLCSELIASRNQTQLQILRAIIGTEFWLMLAAAALVSLLLSRIAQKPFLLCVYALMYCIVTVPVMVVLAVALSLIREKQQIYGESTIVLLGTLLGSYTVVVSFSLLEGDVRGEKSLKQSIYVLILVRIFVGLVCNNLISF